MAEHALALLGAQGLPLAEEEFRDVLAVGGEQGLGRRRLVEAGHGEHHVVLGQEPAVRADQRGSEPLEEPAAARLRLTRETIALDERLPGVDELGPRARERAGQGE